MSVLRSCCLAVSVIAAAAPGTSHGDSLDNELPPQRAATRQEIIRQGELAVLRQKVSMPLDRLVEPVSLAEWRNTATVAPQISSPVAPQPAAHARSHAASAAAVAEPAAATTSEQTASADPFADDPAPQAGGKLPSGKLMGIVGRALFESAPVPSLEGLREHLPEVPMPAGGGAPPAAEDPFGAETGFAPADESDPFAEPAAAPAEAEAEDSEPTTTPEEDPFG